MLSVYLKYVGAPEVNSKHSERKQEKKKPETKITEPILQLSFEFKLFINSKTKPVHPVFAHEDM